MNPQSGFSRQLLVVEPRILAHLLNAKTTAEFQGHSSIITPFTPHICGVHTYYAETFLFTYMTYNFFRT